VLERAGSGCWLLTHQKTGSHSVEDENMSLF